MTTLVPNAEVGGEGGGGSGDVNGEYKLVQTINIIDADTTAIENLTAHKYKLRLINLVPEEAVASLGLRARSADGGGFNSGLNYSYSVVALLMNGGTTHLRKSGNADNQVHLTDTAFPMEIAGATVGLSGEVILDRMNQAGVPANVASELIYSSNNGIASDICGTPGMGMTKPGSGVGVVNIEAVQIFFLDASSDPLAMTGTVEVWESSSPL